MSWIALMDRLSHRFDRKKQYFLGRRRNGSFFVGVFYDRDCSNQESTRILYDMIGSVLVMLDLDRVSPSFFITSSLVACPDS